MLHFRICLLSAFPAQSLPQAARSDTIQSATSQGIVVRNSFQNGSISERDEEGQALVMANWIL